MSLFFNKCCFSLEFIRLIEPKRGGKKNCPLEKGFEKLEGIKMIRQVSISKFKKAQNHGS